MACGHRRVGVSLRLCAWRPTPTPALPLAGGGSGPSTSSSAGGSMRSGLKPTAMARRRWVSPLPRSPTEVAEQVERRDLVLWCLTQDAAREWGRPYGPGLLAFGLDPALVLIVEARNAEMAAWALEEGLKSRALIAALAEIEIKTPLMARRLSLAAQASRTPCLLLSGRRQSGLPGTLTSWRIAAMKSGSAPFDATAPGAPSWQLTLERCRGSAPGRSFIVEFSHESFRFRLSAASSDRAAEAGESSERRHAFSR